MLLQKEKRDIAIIIPYVNLPDYVIELLYTICTKYSYHIYLIDNNSNEETKKKLKSLEEREYLTIVYNETNIGCASAWNQGIELAILEHEIDYAVILNNDVLLHKDCVDNMIKVINKYGIPFVSGFDVAKECEYPKQILEQRLPDKKFIVDAPQFSCYALSIKLLDILKEREQGVEEYPGRFDQKFYPAYFEDNDFHYRLKLKHERGVATSDALYYHYGSRTIKENVDVGEISDSYYIQNKQRYIEKWGGEPGKEKFKIPFNNNE